MAFGLDSGLVNYGDALHPLLPTWDSYCLRHVPTRLVLLGSHCEWDT